MPDDEEPSETVHIIFLGSRTEHVDIALSEMDADALHIITSTRYQKDAEGKIGPWCKEFKLREGMVQAIDDLFEATAVQSLLGAVHRIVNHEKEREFTDLKWMVGITGGTQLMGAVGTYAANMIGGTPYYVHRIKENGEFLEGGVPMEFPDLVALNSLSEFKPKQLKDLLEREGGSLSEVVETGGELFKIVTQLQDSGLVTVDSEEKKWTLTEAGKLTIGVTLEGPSHASPKKKESEDGDAEKPDPIDEIGECVVIFREISDHNCHCPITAEALRIHGLTIRAELWTWEEQDYLLLRAYDSKTGEAKKLDKKHPMHPQFKEKRIVADIQTLAAEFLNGWFTHILFDHLKVSKKKLIAAIAADDAASLSGLLALYWLSKLRLIPDSDVSIGDSGIDP